MRVCVCVLAFQVSLKEAQRVHCFVLMKVFQCDETLRLNQGCNCSVTGGWVGGDLLWNFVE